MRRFWASKRTTSTSFLTVENAATRSPDGDAIGESSWLPPPGVGVGAERPAEVAGLAGLDQLRQVFWRSQRLNSASKSSGSIWNARSTAPTRAPNVFLNS